MFTADGNVLDTSAAETGDRFDTSNVCHRPFLYIWSEKYFFFFFVI